jgi:hypothetical protein
LSEQQTPRELETLGGVRVVRAHLRRGQRCQRNLFSRVVEEDDLEGVAGELRSDQMG